MEPIDDNQLGFVESAEVVVRTAMEAGMITLGSVADDWRNINFLDLSPEDAREDEDDRSRLVNAEEVLRELFALRDQILSRELPPILAGLWATIERAWDNKKAAVAGWIALLGHGELGPLYAHFRNLALQTSPRSFIGRMNAARREAEQRMRKRHLFSKGEERWQRKVSHRK